jgi:hypothetical protein
MGSRLRDINLPRKLSMFDYLGAGILDEFEACEQTQETVRYAREMIEPQLEGSTSDPGPDTVCEHRGALSKQVHS